MTVPQILLTLGAAGIVAVCCSVAAAYSYYRENLRNQQARAYGPPRPLSIDRSVLGPCGICRGDVDVVNGYRMPCRHFVHYTCNACLTRAPCTTPIDWRNVCTDCRNQRGPNEEGSRQRRRNECVCCQRSITDAQDDETLECNHHVHSDCWDRMERSGMTTCPRCLEFGDL